MLAHGAVLRKNFFSASDLVAIVKDFRAAGLAPEEVAIMSFAQKISTRAHEVAEGDIQELRSNGLSDEEILDVVLASAARNFFSKALDSLGTEPDEKYRELEPELIDALLGGEPSPWQQA